MALLDYTNAHAKEIQAVVKAADDKTVADVQARAESGQLRNWLDGEYRVARQDRRARLSHERRRVSGPGTSFMSTRPGTASGQPEVVQGVDDLTKPVGTRDAVVPRGYVLPRGAWPTSRPSCARTTSGCSALEKPMRVEGEAFLIKPMRKVRSGGYDMTVLDGAFARARDARVSGRHVLRRHGAADGERRVLLPRAAGARRLRRLGRARRGVESADVGARKAGRVSDFQGAASPPVTAACYSRVGFRADASSRVGGRPNRQKRGQGPESGPCPLLC